jgi:uncharacterized membrane protein SirB2
MDLSPVFKHVHLGLAAVSIAGFALRGLAVLLGARWPLGATACTASMVVDTLLLAAGVALWARWGWATPTWLWVKGLWLLAYIVLGSFALRRARRWSGKALCFVLALACVAQLVITAHARDPLGALRWWL